ncbi:DUF7544 domain-containing protein [Halopiger djelfimassiliensis]|uniref:DUF7544 domain-containing protein n=1 Tax=Halopiger djelfimassiliensis TaxID=1293047 RepID=UPI0006777505|nr:hypothetical protein [Halopiger djelfimassiliensis]
MDAIDDLSDAIDVTRELLLPVRAGLWLKLAIVVFFVGGGMGSGFPSGNPGMTSDGQPVDGGMDAISEDVLVAIAAVVVVLLLIWLVFGLIGAVLEFVFIESLRSTTVHIRRYSRANLGRGLRLFSFRLVAGLALLLLVGGPAVFAFMNAGSFEAALGPLLLIALFAIPVYAVYAIAMRFTSEFVAPIMLLEERGVLGSWSRFWSTLKANWTEYAVYLLLVWLLQLVVSAAVTFLVLIGSIVVAIPFVIVGLLLATLGDIGVVLAVGVAIVGFLTILLFVALVQMPIRTYFQYYALLLLGDTNEELDLIPDQRAAVRAGGPATTTDTDSRSSDERWGGDDRFGDTETRDGDRGDEWSTDDSDDRDDW